MPYTKGTTNSLSGLLAAITTWVTDSTIHGDDAWTIMRSAAHPKGTIFKAKGLNGGNNCYIGILHLTMTKGETYANWLLQTDVLIPKLIWNENKMNKKGSLVAYNDGNASFSLYSNPSDMSSGKTDYSLSNVEIVSENGESLVFGVFKQYQSGLDWVEQPGGLPLGELGLPKITVKQTGVSGDGSKYTAPLYPGIGYPGIGIPSGEPSQGTLTYWLIKDACRLTVVTRYLDANNVYQWDVGHAGMLIPYHGKMQYPFPAVVAGSTTGLQIVGSRDSTTKAFSSANYVSYNKDNLGLSRTLPAFPATLATMTDPASNVCVCLPDGQWQCFANGSQSLKSNVDQDNSNNYWFSTPAPTRSTLDDCYIKPTDQDLQACVEGFATTTSDGKEESAIASEALDVVQGTSGNANMLGRLWRMYWPGADYDFGEVAIDGKAGLLLPNGWEGRLFETPDTQAKALSQSDLLATLSDIETYSKQFRMLIRLED